ncbi:ribonuclease H-like domain-containing protein [Tanacetum coccineum]|uniref:Ribonuclease H-like domain-containing protein n=1 Tax=Tanacetum coccineum TaxID=301880 RepID=A0ABQ4WY76_9ASTR
MLWEWRGIANMDFIKLGGSSRVFELIFTVEKYGAKNRCWLVLVLSGRLGKSLYKLVVTAESIKLLLTEEKFFKIKQVVEEEQTQPEYLQELLQNLLKDLQILNEIQPLKQETSNLIQKNQEEKSTVELLAEERLQKANQALNESQSSQEMRIQDLEIQKQQCLEEMKEWMNDLGIREYQKEEIDIGYKRKCEDKIHELKDRFNGLSIEIRKIIQEAEELRESEARARIQKIIIDDDDDDLGFYAVHPNTIHTPVSQNVEPKDSLIMGDGHINTTPETETIIGRQLFAHLAQISPEIVEVCVDDDDTDDDYDYDDDFYDCVDFEEDGGEIDLDISKIVDISLREKLVESYLLIEKVNAFSLSPPIPISPILCPSSTIPVVDIDLPLEEADVPSFSDDSMIFSEYESFTFDDEPVMAEVNVFDEINTSELSYPGIGENVVLDEEEDTFTFTTRTFLPFVTYPEVLPASYSTGSEDKIFNPGIFDNDAFKDKSSKELAPSKALLTLDLAPSKALLTLDVFDPLHPPLMDFHDTKAFSGFIFSLLKIFSKKFFEPGIKNATATSIPSAFSTMTLQDPTWHMDIGASSHLNFNTSNLSTIFNKRLYPSVHVGDSNSILVTNTGHSIIPFIHRPLHLHNVLVTPNIIKNLISVRQFTRDNIYIIEFDAFGFSVKDFLTRHILLSCDRSGDLYPVTKPSTTPTAFLSTSTSIWNQRLSHPGDEVLCSLVSRQFISSFMPVVKPATIHTVFSIVVSRKWLIHQLDVKNAFLDDDLSETVYMHHPPDFVNDSVLQVMPHGPDFITVIAILLYLFIDMDLRALNYFLVDTESKLGPDGVPVQDPTLYRSLVGGLQYLMFTRDVLSLYGLEVGSIRRIQVLDTAYWGFLGARKRRIFLDGYGVLVFRIVIFKISSFKLQNARL